MPTGSRSFPPPHKKPEALISAASTSFLCLVFVGLLLGGGDRIEVTFPVAL